MNPSRLRILLAIGIYEPRNGGASEWLKHYATWLAQRGHQVCIACERAEISGNGPFQLLTLLKSIPEKNSWKRAVALQHVVKEFPADVMHDTGCLLASDIFHPLMGSLIHNWRRQLRAFPPLLRFRRCCHVRLWRDVRLHWHQLRRQKILVACSKKTASDFAQLGFKNAVVIPNGIERAPLPPEKIRALRDTLGVGNRLLVLVTATNFYLKGVMTVLRALSEMDAKSRGNFLVIITGHNRNEIFSQYLQRHHLSDGCRLVGWVENIADYYQAADIFLHPTYHDAGSLSTLKALAAGCAVVTSRFDGSADFIDDGVNGFILNEPGNAKALVEILRRLQNEELRNQLRVAALKLTPLLGQEQQFQKLEALYFDFLSGKTRA